MRELTKMEVQEVNGGFLVSAAWIAYGAYRACRAYKAYKAVRFVSQAMASGALYEGASSMID